MAFGLLIIGSELLTGKRKDGHLAHAIERLSDRGLELAWCKFLVDDAALITAALRHTLAGGDVVFSFGGIGSTPDDLTRESAAMAAGLPLVRHPEVQAILEERFGAAAYPQRIRMADLPAGCTLIPNPVNRIPGFSIRDHHFFPGFPQMAWPMMEWVLGQRYRHLFQTAAREVLLTIPDASEGQLGTIMEAFAQRFPSLRFSSLPAMCGSYRETELGVRGAPAEVEVAVLWLTAALQREGFRWRQRRLDG